MKKQHGRISTGAVAGIVIAGALAVTGITLVSSYYGAYEYGATSENVIKAEYKNMENILAQYSLKVSEAAQVPSKYAGDMKDVMTSVMTARQGAGGSGAAMQWFKEHQIQLSPDMYTKIQQIIEAGRNKFENSQTKFIDTKRGYQTTIDKDLFLTRGWWLKQASYPKINLDDYKIVSSGHAQETFKSGVDTGLKVF